MRFEKVHQPVAPFWVFLGRLIRSVAFAALVVGGSLAVGMWGYGRFGQMPWPDAFANAAMILSGMGPLDQLQSRDGKLFEGAYALYSGFVVLAAASLVVAPILHRFLHKLHLDDGRPA